MDFDPTMHSPHADHTVTRFTLELRQLNAVIQEMGTLAASQLQAAMKALSSRDSKFAAEVVLNDELVNRLEHEVDTATMRLLALRQPVALDLRAIVAALRISIDLERVADYAANVAKRVRALSPTPFTEPIDMLLRMGEVARDMIGRVVEAYQEKNVDLAMEVWRRDDAIDALYKDLMCILASLMSEDSRHVPPCIDLLLMSKSLERIGDHVTNIAEHVCFLVQGTCRHSLARRNEPTRCTDSVSWT